MFRLWLILERSLAKSKVNYPALAFSLRCFMLPKGSSGYRQSIFQVMLFLP